MTESQSPHPPLVLVVDDETPIGASSRPPSTATATA